ncbi:MAG: pseudouridine synthase, partial [Candidatus Rokuibacteriota bacterium]
MAGRLAELSRMRLKGLIEAGRVVVNGRRVVKAGHRVRPGERVEVSIPPPPRDGLAAETIALRVVFEDEHVLVVDKPAGMVTHPGAGRPTGTLAAAALAHAPEMAGVGSPRRPGIVHRLDKGTSGLIVLAKTQAAYDALTAQLTRRTVSRRYLCLAQGAVRRSRG